MNKKIKNAFIMIVDDNPKNLQLLANVLGEQGYQIGMAENGIQALKAVEVDPPDLMLLDVMMPVMDGFETCKRLKESPATQNFPVIFLTAITDSENIVKGFNHGAIDYITKPFDSIELLTRVQTHLELKFSREIILEQRDSLEDEVEQRTIELKQTNVLLQKKIDDYEKAKTEIEN